MSDFRVVGEHIDRSMELDGQTYLVESKWKSILFQRQTCSFLGVRSRANLTRGVFIALNGISAQAREAITRGKAPSFFVMDGHDLMMILSEAVTSDH